MPLYNCYCGDWMYEKARDVSEGPEKYRYATVGFEEETAAATPGGTCSIMQLLRSLQGFSDGYLDLGGRHQSRHIAMFILYQRFEQQAREYLYYSDVDPDSTYTRVLQTRLLIAWRIPTNPIAALQATGPLSRVNPQFQRLKLDMLPVEIIDRVFPFMKIPEIVGLASTSHFFSWNWSTTLFSALLGPQACTLPLRTTHRFIDQRTMLQVRTLTFSRDTILCPFRLDDEVFCHHCDILGDNPLSGSLLNLLINSTSVVTLQLKRMWVNEEAIRIMADLPKLQSLELFQSLLTPEARRLILEDQTLPLLPVTNLSIQDSGLVESMTWQATILPICPNLLNLTFATSDCNQLSLPALDLIARISRTTLERMAIYNPARVSTMFIVVWLDLWSLRELALTHLKLYFEEGYLQIRSRRSSRASLGRRSKYWR
ncbi:hypothetical protein NP233_g8652 [Leucocoprinus birnbaumii]|uniref:F-box domain-containing protein n=1 Tax=Leucocoprinus birnbaumii TaxID=56174 RepID=A0AAD5VLX4_9AGAR|nr:hypothetical protein NP233_g8652 [Leucocoprinus birnbaumii]